MITLFFSATYSFAKSTNIKSAQLIPQSKRISAPKFHWGETINSKTLVGKITYINFWAEWCRPCKNEIPFLIQLRDFYNYPVFKMVFLNMDKKENLKKAKSFWKTVGKDAPSLYSSEFSFKKEFSVETIPSHILIDKKGRIAMQFHGDINNQKIATNIKKWIFKLIQE